MIIFNLLLTALTYIDGECCRALQVSKRAVRERFVRQKPSPDEINAGTGGPFDKPSEVRILARLWLRTHGTRGRRRRNRFALRGGGAVNIRRFGFRIVDSRRRGSSFGWPGKGSAVLL